MTDEYRADRFTTGESAGTSGTAGTAGTRTATTTTTARTTEHEDERGYRAKRRWSDTGTLGIVAGMVEDLTKLVRKEAELARAELAEKVDQVRAGMTALSSGALVTYAGVIMLLFALAMGINVWIDAAWLSLLIVGGIVTIIGAVLLGRGRSDLKASNLTPTRTARSLRKDADMIRDETRRTHV